MNIEPLVYTVDVALKRLAIKLHVIHPPHLDPVATGDGWPLKGINARYHGGDDQSPLDVVVRAGVESPAQIQVIANAGVKFIALVENPDKKLVDDIASFIQLEFPGKANLVGIELGNELDLAGLTPKAFADFLSYSAAALAPVWKGDTITGGISRVRPDTLRWLKEALDLAVIPQHYLIGIHRYSIDNDASTPQLGYVNRDEECLAILEAAHPRRLAFTEFGYPLLDGYTQADYEKAIESTKVDIDYFKKMGAKYAIYYQWLNGPTNEPIDRFGLQNKPELLNVLKTV